MIKNIRGTHERSNEIEKLGKQGTTTLSEVAAVWECSTENIVGYLHRLQERKKYAYLIDGRGRFRIFKDFE